MTASTLNITSDGSLQPIKNYQVHKEPITGMLEIGGNFGGGTLSLFISLSNGTVKNTWDDLAGLPFSTTEATTLDFDLPTKIGNAKIELYYTLSGSTSPDLNIIIVDNT